MKIASKKQIVVLDKKEMVKLCVERIPILHYPKEGIFFNSKTGKKSSILEKIVEDVDLCQIISVESRDSIRGVKVMYDDIQDAVALIYCSLDTSYPCDNEPREWKETNRAYISRDCLTTKLMLKNTTEGAGNEFSYVKFDLRTFGPISMTDYFIVIDSSELFTDELGNTQWNQSEAMRPFHKLFGTDMVLINGNRMVCLDNFFSLNAYIMFKQPKIMKDKNQVTINKLLTYDLSESCAMPENLPALRKRYDWNARKQTPLYETLQKYAVIQRIEESKEPLCVIRTFFKSPVYGTVKEGGRIYVGKKDYYACKMLEDGNYVFINLIYSSDNWNFYMEDFDSSITDGTLLETFGKKIGEIEPENRMLIAWSFLRWPSLELLYLNDLYKLFMNKVYELSYFETPKDLVSMSFGNCLGISDEQAEFLMPFILKHMPKIAVSLYKNEIKQYGFVVLLKHMLCSDAPYSEISYVKARKSTDESDSISDISMDIVVDAAKALDEFMNRIGINDNDATYIETDYYACDAFNKFKILAEYVDCIAMVRRLYGLEEMKKFFDLIADIYAVFGMEMKVGDLTDFVNKQIQRNNLSVV